MNNGIRRIFVAQQFNCSFQSSIILLHSVQFEGPTCLLFCWPNIFHFHFYFIFNQIYSTKCKVKYKIRVICYAYCVLQQKGYFTEWKVKIKYFTNSQFFVFLFFVCFYVRYINIKEDWNISRSFIVWTCYSNVKVWKAMFNVLSIYYESEYLNEVLHLMMLWVMLVSSVYVSRIKVQDYSMACSLYEHKHNA